VDRSVKNRKPRRRRLPPGQRLLGYIALSAALAALQGQSIPAGVPIPGVDQPGAPVVRTQPPFQLTERMQDLEKGLKAECAKPNLSAGIFAIEPKTGKYIDVAGKQTFPAASMIKVPVLVSLLEAVDKQQVKLDDSIAIKEEHIGGGSGILQWQPVGTQKSVREVAELMIVVSDNTATNMIIDLLGGQDVLNKKYADWGLNHTKINNLLPDLEGTNTTSPFDLAFLLGKLDQGAFISEDSRKLMYSVMERTKTKTLLPQGLAPGAKIAHKTGDIAKMVGDTGIITTPNGQRYMIAVQVSRPWNDRRANQLVRDVSRIIYGGITGVKVPAPKI
jgi:beta-lactamase class A